MPQPQKARIGDVTLNYVIEGQGNWIVAIGGFATAYWQSWTRYLPALAGYKVLALDSRGSGASDAPDQPYSTAMMARDVLGLMDHLGIEKAHVLGRSLGGAVAQELALQQQHRVRSLALSASFASMGNRGRNIVEHWIDTIVSLGFEKFFAQLMPYFFTAEFYASRYADVQRTIDGLLSAPRSVHGFVNTGHAVIGHDTWDRLHQIKVPALILTGAEDAICPVRDVEAMAARIPNAELHIFPKSAHGFLTEVPAAFEKVPAFFARH